MTPSKKIDEGGAAMTVGELVGILLDGLPTRKYAIELVEKYAANVRAEALGDAEKACRKRAFKWADESSPVSNPSGHAFFEERQDEAQDCAADIRALIAELKKGGA